MVQQTQEGRSGWTDDHREILSISDDLALRNSGTKKKPESPIPPIQNWNFSIFKKKNKEVQSSLFYLDKECLLSNWFNVNLSNWCWTRTMFVGEREKHVRENPTLKNAAFPSHQEIKLRKILQKKIYKNEMKRKS